MSAKIAHDGDVPTSELAQSAYTNSEIHSALAQYHADISKLNIENGNRVHDMVVTHLKRLQEGTDYLSKYLKEASCMIEPKFSLEDLTAGTEICGAFMDSKEHVEPMSVTWKEIAGQVERHRQKSSRHYLDEVEKYLVVEDDYSRDVKTKFNLNEWDVGPLMNEFSAFVGHLVEFSTINEKKCEAHRIEVLQEMQSVDEQFSKYEGNLVAASGQGRHTDLDLEPNAEERKRKQERKEEHRMHALRDLVKHCAERVKKINDASQKTKVVATMEIVKCFEQSKDHILSVGERLASLLPNDRLIAKKFSDSLRQSKRVAFSQFEVNRACVEEKIEKNTEKQRDEWNTIAAAVTNIDRLCRERRVLVNDLVSSKDDYGTKEAFFKKAEDVVNEYEFNAEQLAGDIEVEKRILCDMQEFVTAHAGTMKLTVEAAEEDFSDVLIVEETKYQTYVTELSQKLCERILGTEHAIRQLEHQRDVLNDAIAAGKRLGNDTDMLKFYVEQKNAIVRKRDDSRMQLEKLDLELTKVLSDFAPHELDLIERKAMSELGSTSRIYGQPVEMPVTIGEQLVKWKAEQTRKLVNLEAKRRGEEAKTLAELSEQAEDRWSLFDDHQDDNRNPIDHYRKAQSKFSARLRKTVVEGNLGKTNESSVDISPEYEVVELHEDVASHTAAPHEEEEDRSYAGSNANASKRSSPESGSGLSPPPIPKDTPE